MCSAKTPLTTAELDERLSLPTEGVLQTLRSVPGDIMVLGAGGKMGPTLARMLQRGLQMTGENHRNVYAVSRFSSSAAARSLQEAGVRTIPCDLMNRDAILQLPDVPNAIFMAGQKFGTRDSPELTWATNTLVPALVAEKFRSSRIVALSTGCVYPLVPANGPGSAEDSPLCPPGEYSNSCVGRERIFEYFSKKYDIPMVFVRLCYAIDLRYGVLMDLAQKIFASQPVDIGMSGTHVIWQGDANARIIQCLTHTSVPPVAVNVTGLERLPIRSLALRLGELLHKDVQFTGQEAALAWLWDAHRSYDWFGPPSVSIDEMLTMTAEWVLQGGETLNRPTHFEVTDGQF